MPPDSDSDPNGFSIDPAYRTRVRGTVYLWGSAGLTADIAFPSPPMLHIRNDRHGDPISIGTQLANGTKTVLGTLQPGECVSTPIQNISGVFASCATESLATCTISRS